LICFETRRDPLNASMTNAIDTWVDGHRPLLSVLVIIATATLAVLDPGSFYVRTIEATVVSSVASIVLLVASDLGIRCIRRQGRRAGRSIALVKRRVIYLKAAATLLTAITWVLCAWWFIGPVSPLLQQFLPSAN
jgi:hypothetical protein